MAVNDADGTESNQFEGTDDSASLSEESPPDGPTTGSDTRVGDYTWREFMEEFGYEDDVSTLYSGVTRQTTDDSQRLGLGNSEGEVQTAPHGDDWDRVDFDPEVYLGFHPDELADVITDQAASNGKWVWQHFSEYCDPETTPVVKDEWTWEHFKWQYHYEDDGSIPHDSDGNKVELDESEYLGFEPEEVEGILSQGDDFAQELKSIVDDRTVNITHEEEDDFFSTDAGNTTVANRYDLEKAVPMEKKLHFREVERYWVNKPYAFVIVFHSEKENEKKYYAVEPYRNQIEDDLQEFMSGKLRTAIKYSEDEITVEGDEDARRAVIDRETKRLLRRYDLFKKVDRSGGSDKGIVEQIRDLFDTGDGDDDEAEEAEPEEVQLDGIEARPEPAVIDDDADQLNEYQVEKLLYYLKRNFIGYERIDPIKHDINVEDISCDGYNSPVFVYHSGYEQIISNIYHGKRELDDFVVKLAQRSGKGISKRRPQVDATLPDGSRAQLTLGKEVSDHGTNYTIRQFKDVPFTPIDLINWNTFSLDEMAFLWLCIENHKSLIFAGGTASGKTTSLNAVSLFIPSNTKIVSIEDTREVELPQRNWIASVTRPSFSEDSQGDVDEFDLLEAALRQRPDYIVMGEIRGEEGRTLFQVMSTGHTTYTTFHADSVGEVLKRFTTDPINVSKTMFTALDLVSIQTQTRVQGNKVRRNKNLTEINHYDAENDEINVQDVYQWQAETDEYLKMGDSNTLDEIQFDRGWSYEKLQDELFKRRVILAYLIKNGLNEYVKVAATVQAYINDPDTILTLIANGKLEESLEDLREMESVEIDVDPEDEELVPRPDANDETYNLSQDILERAEESLFDDYRGKQLSGLGIDSALSGSGMDGESEPAVEPDSDDEFDFGDDGSFMLGGDDDEEDDFSFSGDGEDIEDGPSWLNDDGGGFDFGDDDGGFGGFGDDAGETAADASTSEDTDPAPDDTPQLESGEATADASTAEAASADPGEEETLPETTDEPEPPAADDSAETEEITLDLEAAAAQIENEDSGADEPTTDSADSTDAADGSDAGEGFLDEAESDDDAGTSADFDGEEDPGPIFGEVEDTGTESMFDTDSAPADEGSFFGDDDEPFFGDEDDVGSIFGDEDGGSVFSDDGDDPEPEDDGGMFGESDEPAGDEDGSVFEDDAPADAASDDAAGDDAAGDDAADPETTEDPDATSDVADDAEDGSIFGEDADDGGSVFSEPADEEPAEDDGGSIFGEDAEDDATVGDEADADDDETDQPADGDVFDGDEE
ncbi:ATPase, T2SS/T4P/T4SS family [Haloarchaeobius amylolyticus]|uniref:ATPase, T2SS/T4P/T4SS family n=1 Tax=Haloarchaeobius amylolyticus TaxID=1198296 RepID=UPI0034A30DF7